MKKKIIETKKGPSPKGKYSQMVIAGPFVFISGQLPFRPDGVLVNKDIKRQTQQILENIRDMLEEAGLTLDNVVKIGVYLHDIDDFEAMNEVYSNFFSKHPPARTTLIVSDFPPGIKIEIDAIALT